MMGVEKLKQNLAEIHADAFHWALSCCAWSSNQAEDVLQAAYVKVLSGKAKYSGQSTLKTWFYGVIRNTAREQKRGFWSRMMLGDQASKELESMADINPNAEQRIAIAEEDWRIVQALRNLSDRQQEILHLVFYQGYSIEEAARVMSVSIGTARTHYERGKQALGQALRELRV